MEPLTVLILAVLVTVFVSAFCSLMEATLYAVPHPHVKHLAEEGSKSARRLLLLKEDIGRPISAILILNTISNTGGASLAGWASRAVFDDDMVVVFSVGFVLAILYLSEILPKTLGVQYCKPLAGFVAYPLSFITTLLSPIISFSQWISRLFGASTNSELPTVSQEEVLSMAAIGTEEGALDHFEGSVITNVIGLDQLLVRDVLTPRVVVFRMCEATLLRDIRDSISEWNFTRVPIFAEDEPEHLTGYVTQRDVYREIISGNEEKSLKDISRELETVPELMRADQLLLRMFEKREHILSVVDEHGSLAGIITLEDIIEEVVGMEIVDEYDTVSDLRTFARILRTIKRKRPVKEGS